MRKYQYHRLESDGWNDYELVYTAAELGVYLCPFAHDTLGGGYYPEFIPHYEKYSGLLVGQRKDVFKGNPGHAIAKVGDVLIDPLDGKEHSLYGGAFHSLYQRVFFAWTNPQPIL